MDNTDESTAFENHIQGHVASMLALAGAETEQHRGMILSALMGTWEYAVAHEKKRGKELE